MASLTTGNIGITSSTSPLLNPQDEQLLQNLLLINTLLALAVALVSQTSQAMQNLLTDNGKCIHTRQTAR